jgi:holo-[acyl-carrier protein] synthase
LKSSMESCQLSLSNCMPIILLKITGEMSTSPGTWQKVSQLNKNDKKYQGNNPCNDRPFIYNIGTDIIEVKRVKSALEKYPGFKTRVYTTYEIAFCEDKKNKTARYISYAQRFAAKEAVAKAFGTGIGKTIFFGDIEVQNMPSGQPMIKLSAKALEFLVQEGQFDLMVSLSGTKDFAVAFVILFYNQTVNKEQRPL